MNRHSLPRLLAVGAAAMTMLVSGGAVALGHVESPDGDAIPSGSTVVVHFRVPHGCAGAATTGLDLQLPDGVVGAKPESIPGWSITTERVQTDPYTIEGTEFTDRVGVISWSGGDLPDDAYLDFGVLATFLGAPGEIHVPVIQHCGDAEVDWIELAADGQDPESLEHPAPTLTIVAADPNAPSE
jgi:uncharacterized protein YcnI